MNLKIEAAASGDVDIEAPRIACAARDGAVCLETEFALNAFRDMRSLFLARDAGVLVGVLSVFAPSRKEAEIGAAVLPEARRKGVFRALFTAVELELSRYGYSDELFVVDSRSAAGKATAARLGAGYEYTEYALRYAGPCPTVPDRGLEIRRVGLDSLDELVNLRAGEFEDSRAAVEAFERATFASPDRQIFAAFRKSLMVGACSLGFQGRSVSINGLVVDKATRGKGYGQSLMAWIIRKLENEGLEMILDVESRNDNAQHIYRKLGFVQEKAVEYWRRPLPA